MVSQILSLSSSCGDAVFTHIVYFPIQSPFVSEEQKNIDCFLLLPKNKNENYCTFSTPPILNYPLLIVSWCIVLLISPLHLLFILFLSVIA